MNSIQFNFNSILSAPTNEFNSILSAPYKRIQFISILSAIINEFNSIQFWVPLQMNSIQFNYECPYQWIPFNSIMSAIANEFNSIQFWVLLPRMKVGDTTPPPQPSTAPHITTQCKDKFSNI